MSHVVILITLPEPERFIALPDTSGDEERQGWWKVCEGALPTSEIVAWCPGESIARHVAAVLNVHLSLPDRLLVPVPTRSAGLN